MKDGLVSGSYQYKQQDPQYKGEPLHESFANGPTEDRKIRDCLCCLLYLAFWVGSVVIAVFAFTTGQPHLLAAPFSSSGSQCGYSPGYQNYPYVYFNRGNQSQFACINYCPTTSLSASNQCINNDVVFNCNIYGNYSTVKLVSVCYPQSSAIGFTVELGIDFFDMAVSDLKTTWPICLCVLFMALIVSLLVLLAIRACGTCIVISVIFIYFAALVVFGVLCYETALHKIDVPGIDQINSTGWLKVIAIICWIVAGISFLFLLCVFSKLRVAIMIIRATADFTRQQCQTILVPIFMFISVALFFCWWVVVSIYLFSSGNVSQCKGSPYACVNWNSNTRNFLIYYFIGLFWNSEVAIGMCQFVIASTTSYWYFSHMNGKPASSPVFKSYCRALLYHFGSIAFGGLILCILFIIQLILEVFFYFAKEKSLSGDPATNACCRCCLSYTKCCLACFERFIRFISKNAFIMMAITGEGFCTSAHQAFYLIVRSAGTFAITHGIGHILMFFAKLLITIVCAICGYLMITYIPYFSEKLFQSFFPTLVFVVISFVVGTLFMDVFGIGSDTILMCYCLQLDIIKDVKACPSALKAVLDQHRL